MKVMVRDITEPGQSHGDRLATLRTGHELECISQAVCNAE